MPSDRFQHQVASPARWTKRSRQWMTQPSHALPKKVPKKKNVDFLCVKHEATSEFKLIENIIVYQEAVEKCWTLGHPKCQHVVKQWVSRVLCTTTWFLHYHMGFHGFVHYHIMRVMDRQFREFQWLLADYSDPARQATMKESQPTSTIWRINKNARPSSNWIISPVFIGENKKDMSRNPPKLSITTHPVIFEWYSSCLAHRLKPQAGRTARWWVDFEAKRYRIEPACFECLFNTKTLVWNVHLFLTMYGNSL